MGRFDTTLRFDDDQDIDAEMTTVMVAGAWLIDGRRTVRAGVGVVLDGTLKTRAQTVHDVEPGGVVSLGAEYRAFEGKDAAPVVELSLFVSAAWTQTTVAGVDSKTSYFATDARLGARAGWRVHGNYFPYITVRAFGGPVQWELNGQDVTGTDVHHYQVALGAAAQYGPVGLFVEWAGLGEEAVSAGLSTTW